MRVATLLLAGLALAALQAGGQPTTGISQRLDFTRPVARYDLPGRLAEISGLALGPGGLLLAHDDERGAVYRIDPATGSVDRGFRVGTPPVADDLEGIARAGERVFLISSAGRLYEFRLTPEGGAAQVRATDLGVRGRCEVEGLAYHEQSDALLVACKTLQPPAEEVRILRFSVAGGGRPLPTLRVPLAAFRARGHQGGVSPSAIEVDPTAGTLVGLAARESLLFEISLAGDLVDLVRLPSSRHPQPEGITFGPGGVVVVADERRGGGWLTVYGPQHGGGR